MESLEISSLQPSRKRRKILSKLLFCLRLPHPQHKQHCMKILLCFYLNLIRKASEVLHKSLFRKLFVMLFGIILQFAVKILLTEQNCENLNFLNI